MILLLTGCINPNGMLYTALSNTEERKTQYIEAINYYLSNTTYPIVFVENSGTDISHLFTDAIKSNRMEYLSFSGNNNKERGKGVKRNIRKTDPQKSLYKTPYRFLFILNCIFLTGKRP